MNALLELNNVTSLRRSHQINLCSILYLFLFQQYNHTSWSYNPPPVVPLGRGDIGKPNSTDDDYNISPRWRAFVTNNEGNDGVYLFLIFSA